MHTTKEDVRSANHTKALPKRGQKRQRKNLAIFTKDRVWLIHNYAAIKFSFAFMV
jgi:hypothetical protein